MLSILANRTYARLFTAQVVALLGTGLLTVALGLMAFDLAGGEAGVVLGTALTIKMVAYVVLSPLASALFAHLNRKAVLIGADLVRAAIALMLPFVDAVWQIYVLIFVLQAASASFTPAFQAIIPDILKDEKDYTKALSLTRLAYDLENLISPTLAGLLLALVTYHWLFVGTAAGFVVSTGLILLVRLGAGAAKRERPFRERLTRGLRIYLATPRLRGLLALNFIAAASSAMVIVNSVVIVRGLYDRSEQDVAFLFAAYGLGSMLAALALPKVLETRSDRRVMIIGGALTVLTLAGPAALVVGSGFGQAWPLLLLCWFGLGLFYAIILTPSGRLLRRSAHKEDRPAVFAAQFALSHACWLVTYPMVGWLGHHMGLPATMLTLAAMSAIALGVAFLVWPRSYPTELEHSHDDLPADHPHLQAHRQLQDAQAESGERGERGDAGTTSGPTNRKSHRHAFVIDDEHRIWPTQG